MGVSFRFFPVRSILESMYKGIMNLLVIIKEVKMQGAGIEPGTLRMAV